MFELVLGTGNRKKAIEIQAVMPADRVRLTTLADWPTAIEVVEDGDSFAENARLKSTQQAKHLGQWVLGEDSGLSVDALDGAPGIYSARFSGDDATDEKNNDLLLERLEGVPLERRTAYYNCYLSLSDPDGNERLAANGKCCGRIIQQRHGTHGFGYDPMFEIPEYHLTFGQLGPSVKKALSHRARALRQFIPQLRRLLDQLAGE
ncbi:RdgB/HAM1 family non-canonical purine NTP pyrophosphatase [Rosistilla oblonga]|uniref:dITP/XTP pyrophosphatase n=1 Tax=Rosistilla oblonga TaxID=2527990 RepID=A0A518IZA7_9BACT|nr:RdgB/HAM1 family non-canonical purine NTP pyrophosphatase [Rosistilla oblonga]QDV58424.1 Non-canonical purine NTP pyrophosphatase [Rosistilla oblonga]